MKVKLNKVRLSFPNLFTPVVFPGSDKARYDATFLIEPGSENDKAIEAAITAAATEVHAAKADKFLASVKGNSNKYAYLDGNTKEYDGYEGMKFLACHSTVAPGVFTHRLHNGKVCHVTENGATFQTDEFGKKIPVEVDFEVKVPYAGCYVNATVDIYVQKGDFPGVRGSVSGVQFYSDGEAFGGGRPASADEFDDVTEGADADDFS